MENGNKIELKKMFSQEMLTLYKKISQQLKYKSPNLLKQINSFGGYQTALKYINTEAYLNDFGVLWENRRLDLSIEALLIKEKYKEIIPEEIIEFSKKRLAEYNYAPNIIEEPKEEFVTSDIEKVSENMQNNQKTLVYYTNDAEISIQNWAELFLNEKIFMSKNQDLLLRMYIAGGHNITFEDLSEEKGYSTAYPYKGVIMSLSKRIKAHTKIEIPTTEKGEPLWWNIIFNGYFINNQSFEWSINDNLYRAITQLIEEDKIDIRNISISEKMNNCKIKNNLIKNSTINITTKEKIKSLEKHEIGVIDHMDTQIFTNNNENKKNTPLTLIKTKNNIIGTTKKEKKAITPTKEIDEKQKKNWKSNDELNDAQRLDAFLDELFDDDNDDNSDVDLEPSMEDLNEIEKLLQDPFINTPSKPAVEKMCRKPFESVKKPAIDDILLKKENEQKLKWEELKKACLEYYGASCEVCGIDYGYTYGDKFEQLMDVHNLKAKDKEWSVVDVNPEKDLVPICHNCHTILHSKAPNYTIEELKEMIKNK